MHRLNCIDEISPYNLSQYTIQNNGNNGIVNSSFAKIPIKKLSQCNDNDYCNKISYAYKMYNPPAERIRKLFITFRYHNGLLVDFCNYNYSFMLEFTLYTSQILRQYKLFQPSLGKPIP
jgi:uncharacterized radical SAM superfamily Fe-S cluster-containing enzyme